jgi:hypothetical protein
VLHKKQLNSKRVANLRHGCDTGMSYLWRQRENLLLSIPVKEQNPNQYSMCVSETQMGHGVQENALCMMCI